MSHGREKRARAGGGGGHQLKKDTHCVATASCVFLFAKLLQLIGHRSAKCREVSNDKIRTV